MKTKRNNFYQIGLVLFLITLFIIGSLAFGYYFLPFIFSLSDPFWGWMVDIILFIALPITGVIMILGDIVESFQRRQIRMILKEMNYSL